MWDKFGKLLIAVIFIAFGLYHAAKGHIAEGIFYPSMGFGFASMQVIQNNWWPERKPLWNTLSWVFIILACFSFLYMLTIDFHLV